MVNEVRELLYELGCYSTDMAQDEWINIQRMILCLADLIEVDLRALLGEGAVCYTISALGEMCNTIR